MVVTNMHCLCKSELFQIQGMGVGKGQNAKGCQQVQHVCADNKTVSIYEFTGKLIIWKTAEGPKSMDIQAYTTERADQSRRTDCSTFTQVLHQPEMVFPVQPSPKPQLCKASYKTPDQHFLKHGCIVPVCIWIA